MVYQDLGRYEAAADLLEKALASDTERNFGADHPSVAISQSNLALVYQDLGRYEAAADLLEKALASDTRNFGAPQRSHKAIEFWSRSPHEAAASEVNRIWLTPA